MERDDTTRIQTRIDEADRRGGGEVTLPPGTQRTAGLRLPPDVTIVGAGISSTVLIQNNAWEAPPRAIISEPSHDCVVERNEFGG